MGGYLGRVFAFAQPERVRRLVQIGSEFGLVRGWLLIWDPAAPGAGPVELGHHDKVWAVAALPDGRVVSGGGDRRAVVWDVTTRKEIAQISCPIYELAARRALSLTVAVTYSGGIPDPGDSVRSGWSGVRCWARCSSTL
jgi:pimeloyl-ACP methyl ester carboxylesterase